jgi:hypothetical protein
MEVSEMAEGLGTDGAGGAPSGTPPSGTSGPSWRDSLPEDLRSDASIKDFKDLPAFVKNFKELQSHLGLSLRIPSENAGEEDRKTFREKLQKQVPGLVDSKDEASLLKALGLPESAEDYKPPETVKLSEPTIAEVRAFAKENGLTKAQAEKVFRKQAETEEARATVISKAQAEIRAEWGAATDERRALAAEFAEKMGFTGISKALKDGLLDKSTTLGFYKLAKSVGSEGNAMSREIGAPPSGAMTPAEAEMQIAELQKNEAWKNGNHPNHWNMVLKMRDLVGAAAAGRSESGLGGGAVSKTVLTRG